ncbi:MAG: diheme cytochrome c-553 [Myxococcaceae bacterium]
MRIWKIAGAVALSSLASVAFAAGKKVNPAEIKRGEYLVHVGGCNDCHTPWAFNSELGVPLQDMTKMLSGHPEGAPDPAGKYAKPDMAVIGPTFTAFAMPFGIVYSPNLTPDKDSGIGTWTQEMFIKSMRTGRHMGGEKSARPIYPPMPWQSVARMTDPDLKAVFAYLQSIPAIKNTVPDPKVPPEAALGLMQTAEKLEKAFAPPPAAAAKKK